jgi:hypothetical protein
MMMGFNSHLKKFNVVRSDGPNHTYLNPLTNSRVIQRDVTQDRPCPTRVDVWSVHLTTTGVVKKIEKKSSSYYPLSLTLAPHTRKLLLY